MILDSDVAIDLVRKREATVAWLETRWSEGEILATTSLNVAEVLRGAHRDRETLVAAVAVLDGLVEVPFGPRAAKRFGRLMHQLDKAGARVPVVDGMIAAIVLEEGATLATRNGKDFERIAGLVVAAPPK